MAELAPQVLRGVGRQIIVRGQPCCGGSDPATLVHALQTKYYANETFTYPSFLALLEKAETNAALYHGSSWNPYLNRLEPDFMLAPYRVRNARSGLTHRLLERPDRRAARSSRWLVMYPET